MASRNPRRADLARVEAWQRDLTSFLEEHDLECEIRGLVAVLPRRTNGGPRDLVVMAAADLDMLLDGRPDRIDQWPSLQGDLSPNGDIADAVPTLRVQGENGSVRCIRPRFK